MLRIKEQSNIILGSSCPDEIDEEVLVLAQRLSKIHGLAKLASESGGVHIYIASPICLVEFGPDELLPSKMHLAINADKYLGRPPYEEPNDYAAMCMKTGEIYSITDLLEHSSLEVRGYTDIRHQVAIVEKNDYLVDDGEGNQVPKGPGEVVSLSALPADHPVIVYLRGRDFDPHSLVRQFDSSFCVQHADGYWKNLSCDFKASPQHRLIFNIDIQGIRRGWQARILELKTKGSDGKKYHFCYHTSKEEWVPVKIWDERSEEWHLMPGFTKWDPPKYMLGYGTRRNLCLMGFDAAQENGAEKKDPWIGLTEGPLDAARLGPPFCAAMGKSLSAKQADLCRLFERVVVAIQNDEAGKQFKESAVKQLRNIGLPVVVIEPPTEDIKDYGDMKQSDADVFMSTICKKYSLE